MSIYKGNNLIAGGLPNQTGQSGKFLTTDGSEASWDSITVPTKISDLTDDTATNPIDKADTLTDLTATASELNVLDGITANTSELNVLDGITATTSELNYTDGVTSNIQTQLDNKLPSSTKYGADLSYSNSSLQLKDQDGNALGNAVTIESSPAIDDTTITKNSNDELQAVKLVGLTSSITQLNYSSNVTSDIQTQLNNKQATLVSGTNIKTINSTSLLGSGNIDIQATPDDETISLNSSDELQAIGVIDSRDSSTALKYWTGTSAQYDAITTKDSNTLYNITDDTDITLSLLQTIYPVGSIYITTNSTCPLSDLFGTWTLVGADRVLQGAGTRGAVGTTVEESLPNITGTVGHTLFTETATASGSLSVNNGSNWTRGTSSATTWLWKDISIDASNSSSTYQDNAPVQQDAYLVNIYRRTA